MTQRRLLLGLILAAAALASTGCIIPFGGSLYECTIEGTGATCVVVGAYAP